jgi:ribosomal protein L24
MKTGTGTARSRIKRGDTVVFIAGKEYNRYDSTGKRQPARGRVIAVDARLGKVKVEGAMMMKKHQKPVGKRFECGDYRPRNRQADTRSLRNAGR